MDNIRKVRTSMVLSIAWKNIWRNKKRSLIVMTAVLLGTTAGVFTSGLMLGWVDQRIESVIFTEDGHIKIHNPEYLNNEEIGNTLSDAVRIEDYLLKSADVKAVSNRIKVTAMASTSRGNTALVINGVNIKDEKAVSDLYTKIVQNGGEYLNESSSYPIFISDKTAELLRVKNYEIPVSYIDSLEKTGAPYQIIRKLSSLSGIRFNTGELMKKELTKLLNKKEIAEYGSEILKKSEHYRIRSKIVFTFTDIKGELVNQSFRVCGVYKTDNTMFDQMNAYVLKNDLTGLTGLASGDSHEIGVVLNKDVDVNDFQELLHRKFPQASVMNWREMAPDAGMISEYMNLFYLIIMGFIFFALAFGIINTMLMAILDRTKELGMLMAIGMNRNRVFAMIMLETIFLTLVGAIAGMLTGWIIILITGHTGLDFSSVEEGFEAMGWSSLVYPHITPTFFFSVTLLVIVTGILASIYPARKALSLNPVEAIRTDN